MCAKCNDLGIVMLINEDGTLYITEAGLPGATFCDCRAGKREREDAKR